MAIHFEKTTIGTDDFELGMKRKSILRYFLTLPEKKNNKGLAFIIPGFGEDNNSEYSRKLREYISDTYSLVCVTVKYHAIESRPANGGQLGFDYQDIELLKQKLNQYGCHVANTIQENITILDQAIAKAKTENTCDINSLFMNQYALLTSSIYPGQGEYQNFGIMQALDHLFVLADLLKNLTFPKENIIAFGSSHGGYIANLMSKIAPNTFSAVLDNSSYAHTPLHYVVGRQLGNYEFLATATSNIAIACFVVSPWRLRVGDQNFFSPDHQKIRSFLFCEDIENMARTGNRKTQYRFFHSQNDMIAKVEDKIKMAELLEKNGFDVQLSIMKEKDIDGVFVKNLNHGMGLSLKKMFIKLYKTLQPREARTDFDLNSKITYQGFKMDYTFKFNQEQITSDIVLRQQPMQ